MELLITQLEVYIDSILEIKDELEETGYDVSGMDLYIDGLYDELESLKQKIK